VQASLYRSLGPFIKIELNNETEMPQESIVYLWPEKARELAEWLIAIASSPEVRGI
jgi:hypothetical protein